jgi:hypothetical protein
MQSGTNIAWNNGNYGNEGFIHKLVGDSKPKTLIECDYMNDFNGAMCYILQWLFNKVVMDPTNRWNHHGNMTSSQWRCMAPLVVAIVEF